MKHKHKSTSKAKPVWNRSAPSTARHTPLSPAKKKLAKARAKRAGRPYPNLVDNLQAARLSGKASTKAKRKTKGRPKTKGRGKSKPQQRQK